ncbi:hypothetical protein IAQ61_001637 [Plenodomus lingam]|uniref:2EXR domain-containing protein n=1 Tax=Leptosphaeria maculans (strain JN3 / isolate v23.1.3 / race Av1-4-5-6-7-8) TaxID=985895 RepID=M1ZJE5_LEPMJ|nr:hypothetical protein IAQ61_001637 [Plenodomus lingam]CCT61080.1 predicted protein [Plenodomus lingam JN3]
MPEKPNKMDIVKLFRGLTIKHEHKPEAATSKEASNTKISFLQLPGEIRNQIYSYLVYPNLRLIQINDCTKPEHMGYNVLFPAIFRVSRQTRAEALSYLCATKVFQIWRITSANTFFAVIGPAIGNIRDILVQQSATELTTTEASREEVARFFTFIERASSLKVFEVEGLGRMPGIVTGGIHANFMRSLEMVGERGVRVEHWFGLRGKQGLTGG